MQKVGETLWDVYKLTSANLLPGFETGYSIVAATRKKWSSGGDCVGLFTGAVSQPRLLRSIELFREWEAAWEWLLKGGNARPIRVPSPLSERPILQADAVHL